MAFLSTVTDVIEYANGFIMEYGTWSGAGVITGTITTASASTAYTHYGKIPLILNWSFASDGDTAVVPARDQNDDVIKITFTSADSGDYVLIGKSA